MMNDKMDPILETDDWLVPGAEVVEMRTIGYRGTPDPYRSEIAKVGKRDVVLVNGRRYSRQLREGWGILKGGLRQTGSGPHGSSPVLVPVAHAAVLPAEQARIDLAKRNKLRQAMEEWIRDTTEDEKLERVRDLIDQYL